MRQYNPLSHKEEVKHTCNITPEPCSELKNAISQGLGIWLSQMMPMNLQMFEIIKDFIPHLDIQSIKKLFDRLTPSIRCKEYHLEHMNTPPWI